MGSEYDVFLSFRGPDTRTGITDHLYEWMTWAGLRVFIDEEKIHRGEVIEEELKQAIMNSRVYVVVFSRNYASSAWCLRELAMMLDLHRGPAAGRKIILPIFYDVEPCDVKLRTELYRKALEKHEGRYGKDVVKKWEETLVSVGQISGWDSKAIRGEGRFVKLIVQDILGKLRTTDRSLPDHLIGIDDQVSEMLNLLNCDSSGVRIVVLHGMGGIGKTTLASVFYNEISSQFKGCSFLSNVRERSKQDGGTAELLNQLLSDILRVQQDRSCDIGDDVNKIIPRLRGKRILLILDDVDKTSQLKKLVGNNPEVWLEPGSRIIVTTRDCSVSECFIQPELLHYYEMKELDDDHALQLFSRHTFGTDGPPEDYVCLSGQVVKAAGNLPLVLEVIGAHLGHAWKFLQKQLKEVPPKKNFEILHREYKELWTSTLEKLEKVPLKKVFEILLISYDGLDWWEKEIFLDIACFQEQMPKKFAYHLWEARNLYPNSGVPVLINKKLIKVDTDGEFLIHDQLRDMGREIIRSKGLGNPEKFSRVWDPDQALSVVLHKVVTEKIKAMNLVRNSEGRYFEDEHFRGLSNLIYLQLTGGRFIGSFDNLRARLLWLSWKNCPEQLNSTFFKMNDLVVLRISGIRSGDGHVGKLEMPNLRVLEIYNCLIETAPDVSCCLKLEIITFTRCDKMRAIHSSIGELKNLLSLNICACWSLRSLPEELGCARALRELSVTATYIEEVPESIGSLESLSSLVLVGNKIRKLPNSICDLKNLEELDASYCPLNEGIPEEIGRLSSLVNLSLHHSKLRQLPTTISQLSSLNSLNLNRCNYLQELPELPDSLTELSLGVIPNPSNLRLLTELELVDSKLTEVQFSGFDLLTLKIDSCKKLQRLSDLGSLRRLTFLALYFCDKLVEIGGLEEMKLLEKLTIYHCKSIQRIPDLLGLRRLKAVDIVNCRSLHSVPRMIDKCRLRLSDCPQFRSFNGSHRQYDLQCRPRWDFLE